MRHVSQTVSAQKTNIFGVEAETFFAAEAIFLPGG